MIAIPHLAWGAELTRNYNQRTKVMAFRDGAEILGFMMVGFVPFLFGIEGEGFAGNVLDILAAPVALALVFAAALAVVRTPSGYEQPADRTEKTDQRPRRRSLAQWALYAFMHRHVLHADGRGVAHHACGHFHHFLLAAC